MRDSRRGERADLRGPEQRAGLQQGIPHTNIASGRADVRSGGNRIRDIDPVVLLDNMLDRLCDFLLERGASGLCLGGATSEYPRFETAERLEILRRVARRVPRGTPLVAAIGSSSLERTIELGTAAFDHGCQAVLLPMPWFFPYQQVDLAAYVAYVADTLDGPCLLYDLPGFTTGLDADTSISLMQSEPNVIGIKDSSGRVENLLRFVEARGNRDWSLLVGDDRNGLASAEAGAMPTHEGLGTDDRDRLED